MFHLQYSWLPFLFCFHKGLGTHLQGSEGVKKGALQEEDPLLVEKSTLPVSEKSWGLNTKENCEANNMSFITFFILITPRLLG